MDDAAANNATNQPVTLNNGAALDAAVFYNAAPAYTATPTTAIPPDKHLLSSGLKLDTEIFSKGNINIWLMKTQSTPPLPPTHPKLIPSTLIPKILDPLTLISHIN